MVLSLFGQRAGGGKTTFSGDRSPEGQRSPAALSDHELVVLASMLEEIFFESVILDEWEKADKISDLLLKRNNDNDAKQNARRILLFA